MGVNGEPGVDNVGAESLKSSFTPEPYTRSDGAKGCALQLDKSTRFDLVQDIGETNGEKFVRYIEGIFSNNQQPEGERDTMFLIHPEEVGDNVVECAMALGMMVKMGVKPEEVIGLLNKVYNDRIENS